MGALLVTAERREPVSWHGTPTKVPQKGRLSIVDEDTKLGHIFSNEIAECKSAGIEEKSCEQVNSSSMPNVLLERIYRL